VPVDGHSLGLRLRERRVLQRRDRTHVRRGRDRARGGRLIRDDDRRRALDRYDLPALHALRRTFLRRAAQDREEQHSEQRVNQDRGYEASRQSLTISAIARIAFEFHARA
jgi:hypothetical protein